MENFIKGIGGYAKLVKIPIPPLETQQRIVNEMDEKNEYIKTQRLYIRFFGGFFYYRVNPRNWIFKK